MRAGARLAGLYGAPLAIVDAATFDGTSILSRGGDCTGAADSKSGIFSCWWHGDAGPGGRMLDTLVTAGGATVRFLAQCISGAPTIGGINPAATQVLDLRTVAGGYSMNAWHHMLASWDLAAGTINFYHDDVSDKSVVTSTNDVIDYTVGAGGGDWSISGVAGLTWVGALADLYFAPGQYLDFSIVANRRKFISATKKPVYLGADGSIPTGVAPIVYQHLADAEAPANFATNRGPGGNFTRTGSALTTHGTSPSD